MNKPKNITYRAPAGTSVGHVHLKVSDLQRSIRFYNKLLGFEVTTMYGTQAAFLSAGGYHHHIGLNTWHSLGASSAPERAAGLYHVAFLYPTRRDLAVIVKRLQDQNYPISGASDHGVSEAVYLNDPDGNGIELYRDRPRNEWNYRENGSIEMVTEPLNIASLIRDELGG